MSRVQFSPRFVAIAHFSCQEGNRVALSEIDRNLLDRCLQQKPRAWEDFVDRFMGLVVHVVNHTARARSVRLTPADRDDLCAEVFLATIRNDFGVLRNFRGHSSLATYLTVVARRIVVKELLSRMSAARLGDSRGRLFGPNRRPTRSHRRRGTARRPGRSRNGCWAACKAPKPKWCACSTWRAEAIRRLAAWSACRRTALAPSSAEPATRCAGRASTPSPIDTTVAHRTHLPPRPAQNDAPHAGYALA